MTARIPKLVEFDELLQLRERAQRQGRTVVWTNGCFDLLHVGHVRNLRAARALGDMLVVGLNGDDSVRRLKGPGRPIVPEAERAEILAAMECVDYVLLFHEDTPERVLGRLKPDVHCKGAEYAPPNGKAIPESPLIDSYGGRIEFLPLVPEISTSAIVGRIQNQESRTWHG